MSDNRYRGEYSGGPGMPRDDARSLRREGLAERSGQTGGYVKPNKSYEVTSPAEDAYEADRAQAIRERGEDDSAYFDG